MVPLPEPQPQRGEPGFVLGSQEQEPPKVAQESLVDPFRDKPFRKRASQLVKVSPGNDRPLQRVVPRFVPDSELDGRRHLRLEDRHSRADVARLLDEQGETVSQLGRLDADLDPRRPLLVGQQPADRSRTGPDLDPAAANLSRTQASQHPAAQGWNLESQSRIEQIQDRPAVPVVDFHGHLGARVRVDVAERQLHGPPAPVHIVGEVEDRLPRLLSLAPDRILVWGVSVLQPLGGSLHRVRGGQQQ